MSGSFEDTLLTAINDWAFSDPDCRWPRRARLDDVPDRQLLEYVVCLQLTVTGGQVFVCERAGGDE